jgi:hypothetical protein
MGILVVLLFVNPHFLVYYTPSKFKTCVCLGLIAWLTIREPIVWTMRGTELLSLPTRVNRYAPLSCEAYF